MADDEEQPQRRRPLVAGTGWLLFVCAFLPTIRVCNDPVAPIEFPLAYVAYLGAAVLAIMAVVRTLRARRAWFTAWFVMWLATAIAWAGVILADPSPIGSLLVISGGLAGMVFAAAAFHRAKYTSRGMWIGGSVHGALSTVWYLLLAADGDAMWGAYVGLASSFALLVAACVALAQHAAELARKRGGLDLSSPPRVIER